VLWEFRDVLPEEVYGLPPKRDLDFSIDPVLGAVQHREGNTRTRVGGTENVVEINYGQGLHKVKCISMGDTNPICKD
jgi:hypothetical protein